MNLTKDDGGSIIFCSRAASPDLSVLAPVFWLLTLLSRSLRAWAPTPRCPHPPPCPPARAGPCNHGCIPGPPNPWKLRRSRFRKVCWPSHSLLVIKPKIAVLSWFPDAQVPWIGSRQHAPPCHAPPGHGPLGHAPPGHAPPGVLANVSDPYGYMVGLLHAVLASEVM